MFAVVDDGGVFIEESFSGSLPESGLFFRVFRAFLSVGLVSGGASWPWGSTMLAASGFRLPTGAAGCSFICDCNAVLARVGLSCCWF